MDEVLTSLFHNRILRNWLFHEISSTVQAGLPYHRLSARLPWMVIMNTPCLLAIDQGTTSTRALIFDTNSRLISGSQQELTQYFPQDGWVEHDGEQIWQTVVDTVRQALAGLTPDQRVAGIGITNQRETTLLWHRDTGKLLAPAIVWQDRRTSARCQQLVADGFDRLIQQKTGLLIDPYFSATKLAWLLDQVPGARQQAEQGQLCFGTIDTFLLWRLTAGRMHATDATNASRTALFNIHQQCWDEELLSLFDIPPSLLPVVQDSASHFGDIDPQWFGQSLPVLAMAGDQQAALVGQGCLAPGMVKSTYGTGCFLMQNTGSRPVQSQHRLLTTVAYRLQGRVTYALEGSIFVAGAAMQWLRDGLRLIEHASDSEMLARQTPDTGGVYLVPAFTGLGAPYWEPDARGAILGLTRDTGIKEIVTAGLQAVCYQTRDLLEAMYQDGADVPVRLRVDGGMAVNGWLMQFLADMLDVTVERPQTIETTALGISYLAGLQAGIYADLSDIGKQWHLSQEFTVKMPADTRQRLYTGWLDAIHRVKSGKLPHDHTA